MLALPRIALVLSLLGATCAQAKPLVVCTEASPEGFDIAQYTAATTSDASAETVFDRLINFKPGTTDIEPGLAERWEISKDGKTYTFFLRAGVKFQTTDYFKPTRTLNADDVLWSFMRQFDPNHPWYNKAQNGFPYFEAMGLKDLIQSISKVDTHTIRFVLKRPEAPFLRDLAMPFTSIYSAEYAAQLEKAGQFNQLNFKPVGTGPFILSRYTKDAQIRYKANSDYYAGKPPANSLIFAITQDSNVRLQRVRAGECQVGLYPKPDDISSIRQDPNLTLHEGEALLTAYVALNTEHPPLNDARVRQALNLAFDKQAYVKALFGEGNAVPAVNPYPPTLLGYNHDVQDWSYDPEKARALLKEAGVKDGLKLTVFARSGGGPTNPNPALGAQMLQADLAKVGVQLDIRSLEWGELIRRAKQGEHDLVFMGWAGDNGDPDNFVTPNLSCDAATSGENMARWCNPAFNALLNQARGSLDEQARAELYKQAQVIFHNEAPWIPLAYPKLFTVTHKNVTGFHLSPLTNNNFATTHVE
ncbi:dipeptide transport system substrate-binding protein [Pseudomonas duriflava]|uniref:Dipeptide transport system substrate-binding protein n=1 Tax=Pseudomonas duriflava TaxID=459528 RepID=A0A562QCG1_9PSED|nr:ABC transporter substrate-binding protein [Pseudomonas duriflava]TWI54399.1 dipeptide transport system substrate-binding protein [Pseudomonas duriflava]